MNVSKKNGFCSEECSCKGCFNKKNSSLRESQVSLLKLKNLEAFQSDSFNIDKTKNNKINYKKPKIISLKGGCYCKNSNCKKNYCCEI